MADKNPVTIFDYTDPFQYLAAWYAAEKEKDPDFSYRAITERGGLTNKGFVHNLINGKKKLSVENAAKLSAGLGHTPLEAEYFETLASFHLAKEHEEKDLLLRRLNCLGKRGRGLTRAQILRQDQYDFFSEWHHATVLGLLEVRRWRAGEEMMLAKMIYPKVSALQVVKSVRLLERLGLVMLETDGYWRVCAKHLATPPTVRNLALFNYNLAHAELAIKAMKQLPLEKRNMTGLSIGISEKTYHLFCEKIAAFRQDLAELAIADDEADRVYHLNFQFFPTSKTDPTRKTP